MNVSRTLAAWRNRSVWTDTARKRRTLESFAATEEDGGKDLEVAARRIADPELRGHIERHALDERRHARLFRERAAEVASELATAATEELDRPYDLSRGRRGAEVDAHGFFQAGLVDELGELEYVAMLHVAEQRAAELFDLHHALTAHDPRTRAIFAEILKDEKYHVAYTGRFLERWRHDGRVREVESALRAARSSRFLSAWRRLGMRSGAGFGRAVLFVLYWTLLAPFGLLARTRAQRAGWRAPLASRTPHGQY